MIKRNENIVTVSSDLGGFFSNPERVQHLYSMARINADIELVLMPYQVFYLNQLAQGKEIPFDVGGFHGQLGTTESFRDHQKGLGDWLLIHLFDALLPNSLKSKNPFSPLSTMSKIEAAAQKLGKKLYLNVHQDAVERHFEDYLAGAILINNHSVLAVENGPGSKDVEKSKILLDRLKERGAERVDGTFDVVHAVIGLLHGAVPDMKGVSKYWDEALGSMNDHYSRIHLPIGKKAGDSLPILDMINEKKMLRALGDIVKAKGLSVTLENQQSLLWGVKDIWEEVERLKRINEGLQESGIVR